MTRAISYRAAQWDLPTKYFEGTGPESTGDDRLPGTSGQRSIHICRVEIEMKRVKRFKLALFVMLLHLRIEAEW
jgi:hypothetical protein